MFACGGVTVMGKHLPAASNNDFGGVAHADNWAYVMESVARFLNGLSDSDESDDEVSHLSTQSGSALSQSEYESVVEDFEALENQWLNERRFALNAAVYPAMKIIPTGTLCAHAWFSSRLN